VVCKSVLANGRDWILENHVGHSQQYGQDPVKGDKSRAAFKLGPEFKFALTANGDHWSLTRVENRRMETLEITTKFLDLIS